MPDAGPKTAATAIFEEFLKRCERLTFRSDTWKRFTPDPAAFVAPKDTSAQLELLRKQFGDEALMASRIAVQVDGQWRVHAGLRPGKVVVAFSRFGAPGLDILTRRGCVSGRLPILAAMEDAWTRGTLNAQEPIDRTVFVCFSMADVVVLRALGLAATLAGSPGWIRAAHLRAMQNERAPRLVAVGWRPCSLVTEAGPAFEQFCRHLANFDTYLGETLENWSAWRPSRAQMDGIRFVLAQGEPDDIRAVFLDVVAHYELRAVADGSIDSEARSVDANTTLEPWRRLRELRSTHPDDAALRAEAWLEFEQRVERDFVAPAFRAALAEPDPARRDLLLSVAELARLRHPLAARLADRLLELFRTPPQTWHTAFPACELAVLLTITNRALAVHRELHRGPDRQGGSAWRRWSQK